MAYTDMALFPYNQQRQALFSLTSASATQTLKACLECNKTSILNSLTTPRCSRANSFRLLRHSWVAPRNTGRVNPLLFHVQTFLDILRELLLTVATSPAEAAMFLGLGVAVLNYYDPSGFLLAMLLVQKPQYCSRCSTTLASFSNIPLSKGNPKLSKSLRIFIGYDSREDLAYEVCRYTILKHATIAVDILPIKQLELRKAGLYTRFRDATESTEFSFTRFLTPFLAGFQGWALFIDCDFLYTADVRELTELIDDRYAVMCVQHDYTPTSSVKMDGCVQTSYPRKNWSSMVLYNCSHFKNQVLTPAIVNNQSGAFLHRFLWLDDKDIGSIPYTWNFLVGHNKVDVADDTGTIVLPKAIHYTSGGPWFEAWKDCTFSQLWFRARDDFFASQETTKDCL